MSSINSVTNQVTSLKAKTGIGGLVSGMDTDELIEKMTANSRAKVFKQEQKVQLLQWKQTAYRSVSKALQSFQNSYLTLTSATKFRSSAFFNAIKASSSSPALNATATGSAREGQLVIESISQLATAATISSKGNVSAPLRGTISGTSGTAMSNSEVSDLIADLDGKSISFGFNGTMKTVTFHAADLEAAINASSAATPEAKLQDAFQQLMTKTFGTYTDDQGVAKNVINVTINNGEIAFNAPGSTLSVQSIGEDNDALTSLGLTSGQADKISLSTPLSALTLNTPLNDTTYEFSINGETFTFTQEQTLADVMQKVNTSKANVVMSYSAISGGFTITAKEMGAAASPTMSETGGNLLTAIGLTVPDAEAVQGQNAVLKVNGQTIVRSSNTFDLDGVNIALKETSDTPVVISLAKDTTELESAIRKFVEDYNHMIDLMHGLAAEKSYRDYQPLSAQQKAEMKDSDIKEWEDKAKSGMLRSDPLLMDLTSKLRAAVSGTFVDGFSLAQMGIKSTGYTENGKLQIDDDKLKTALATNGEQITNLFTSENGLSTKLFNTLDNAVRTTGPQGKRGSLIEAAGIDATRSDTENGISKQIESTKKMIGTLETRLAKEEQRLWAKFTAMEKALQRLSAQDSFLAQFSQQNG